VPFEHSRVPEWITTAIPPFQAKIAEFSLDFNFVVCQN
jgi:hypothetical protein